ncbi:MAG: response regulator transcription factor [Synechococcaceae cyanobacterium RL_1_2]|nr:response regulator transcription factor [Synechococcaceae cyanobacterium RL_1_2]
MSTIPIPVAIAHDDPIFRLGWEQILARHGQMKLVWIGAVDAKYSKAIRNMEPAIVLISNEYGLDSYKLIQALKTQNPEMKILLLVSRELTSAQLETIRALQIEGYVEQKESFEQIFEGINAVLQGETLWPKPPSKFPFQAVLDGLVATAIAIDA